MEEKASAVRATAVAGDSPQATGREEEDKEARDMSQESAGFSWEEEEEATEAAAAAAEEVLAWAEAAVLAWAEGADPLWT